MTLGLGSMNYPLLSQLEKLACTYLTTKYGLEMQVQYILLHRGNIS